MWSLCVPIHVKSWPKVKMYQAEDGSSIAQIACLAHRKSYVDIICANSVKSWPKLKRNWVKLKLVRILHRIACLANRKSYVVISCATSCENLTTSEIGSSWSRFTIFFKITSIVSRKSYICSLFTQIHMITCTIQEINTQLPWFDH